ncbi:hypothetical protein, partial [Pseudomonas sp. 2995-3]|uniref:hypothetical protein n=1 Tax=Pseudomonas sp. 2995-3 TaxID=1712680 RepID=UPI001303FD15
VLTEFYERELDIADKYIKQFIVESDGSGVPENWAEFMENGIRWMELAASLSIKGIAVNGLEESGVQEMIDAGMMWKQSFESLEEKQGNALYEEAKSWVRTADEVYQLFSDSSVNSDTVMNTHQLVLE